MDISSMLCKNKIYRDVGSSLHSSRTLVEDYSSSWLIYILHYYI